MCLPPSLRCAASKRFLKESFFFAFFGKKEKPSNFLARCFVTAAISWLANGRLLDPLVGVRRFLGRTRWRTSPAGLDKRLRHKRERLLRNSSRRRRRRYFRARRAARFPLRRLGRFRTVSGGNFAGVRRGAAINFRR